MKLVLAGEVSETVRTQFSRFGTEHLDGMSVRVGSAAVSEANWQLQNVAELRSWLRGLSSALVYISQ